MAPPLPAPTGKKSRNGCKTCKIRRVKCDEAKPFCNRCRDLHIKCDGYVIKRPKGREGRGTFFPILPKSQGTSLMPLKITPVVQPACLLSDQEYRYLEVFRQTKASTLAEYLDTTLWNRIVLQATESALPIKHSVIALGALHKALDGDPYPHKADTKLHQSAHYRFALQQYGKALRLTRTSIAATPETQVDTRVLLISSFLSVCFECMHGSTSTAVAHIQSGISMLDDFCSKQPHCISFEERQALPGFLEDEMLSVLSRLESDVTGLYDANTFESFTSARKYLDLLLREVGWFVTSCNEQRWSFLAEESGTCYQGAHLAAGLIPTIEQQNRAEAAYDAYIPDFECALQLAEDLHLGGPSSRSVRPTFITSSILIRSLYFVALKCRDGAIRKRALNMLEGMPRREGIWDAVFVCKVARVVVSVEEGRAGEGYAERGEDLYEDHALPPEERRVTSLKTTFDLYKRRGHIRYLQAVECENGLRFAVGERNIIW
ncbi:hypothetical protein BKA64DRAFT_703813 [Cadophora sp. MPI-SDFR-AT-0126]|nr:hypothetical protein BKA64DRAFT_703813 [Leotiomycetes sp. MPI-SDFR-AT-0126]